MASWCEFSFLASPPIPLPFIKSENGCVGISCTSKTLSHGYHGYLPSACFEHKNLYPGMSKLNNEESHCHELNCHKLNCIASSSIPISSHALSDLKMDALV